MQKHPNIVIVGGGAAGLELATYLGNDLGKSQQANVTLVDVNLTNVWKPLWHEVAAGTLYSNVNELNYVVHGHKHFFNFQLGRFSGLDRANQIIILDPVFDEKGKEIIPQRKLSYDVLVIAVGSVSNDFEIPGVKEHCYFLDTQADCQALHQTFLNNLLRLQQNPGSVLDIAIVGGGATGVELASELQYSIQAALQYKHLDEASLSNIQITLIESAPRLLSNLPEKLSLFIGQQLESQHIKVLTNAKVTAVDEQCVYTDKSSIKAKLKLWAAGIKAPEILSQIGLQTSPSGQLLVQQSLQTLDDSAIFAIGDCASCPQLKTGRKVPPRAQAAHQQAQFLANSIKKYLAGKALPLFIYQDRGSLINLSQQNAIGELLNLPIGNVTLEGKLARLAYRFLYRQHQSVLYGWPRVILLSLADFLTRSIRPRLKLH